MTVTLPDDAPPRLDKALAAAVPEKAALSRSRLMRMIGEGAVSRGGVVVTNPKEKVAPGEVWDIRLSPATEADLRPEAIALTVVHEDADLIVIDKAAGMVVHPAPGSPSGTLVNALLHHCGDTLSGIGGERRPGIVHRIDKDTTGLLVAAKSDRAHHGLAAQFEAHTVTRHYLALVHGVPSGADPRLRGTRGVSFEAGGVIRIAYVDPNGPAAGAGFLRGMVLASVDGVATAQNLPAAQSNKLFSSAPGTTSRTRTPAEAAASTTSPTAGRAASGST